MGKLVANSLSSERQAGLVFSETFVNNEQVVANGATIVGAPTINFGAVLDGTNDSISYVFSGLLNTTLISFVIDFTPDFDTDEDAARYLFDASSGSRYAATKGANASSNSLFILLGNTTIAQIAEGSYSPYWKVGEKNVLQISGDSTNNLTNVWLNGNQILTDDSTAWAIADPANLTIGAISGGSSQFNGTISSFKIFKSLLTAEDATNYYSNSQFDFRNRAVLDLPMGAEQHDPTNVRALDVSKSSAHATFGDGSTSSTYPTKITKHGYSFDGGDYLTGTATGLFNSSQISTVCEFYPDFATDDDVSIAIYDCSTGSRYGVIKLNNAASNSLRIYLGNTIIVNIVEATYSPYWYQYQKNVLIVLGDDTNNLVNVWLNGNQILTDDASAWSAVDPAAFYLGSTATSSGFFDGKITGFQVYPFLLSAVQREQILIDSNKKVNKT